MKSLINLLLIGITFSLTLGGCAPTIAPDTYETAGAGQVNRVLAGRIVSARVVQVAGDNLTPGGGAVGSLAGAGAGAVAAGSLIGQGNGSLIAAIGGAVLGGVAGNYAEKKVTAQQGIEYVVKTADGALLSVVQGVSPRFQVGQRVYVEYGARSRITAAA